MKAQYVISIEDEDFESVSFKNKLEKARISFKS